MSWRRTVTCSHCYNEGHNRLGCPVRKSAYESEPDGYIGRQVHRERAERRQQIESRRCTYCNGDSRGGDLSHNRRTCRLKKADKGTLKEKIVTYRRKFAESLARHGLGIGSLVRVPMSGGYILYAVSHIDWEVITHRQGGERWGALSDDDYHLDHCERAPFKGRILSYQISEDKIDHWMERWLKPLNESEFSFRKFFLDDLAHIDYDPEQEVRQDYEQVSMRVIRNTVDGPISSERVLEQIPANFFEGETRSQITQHYNFDEGARRTHLFEEREKDGT